MRKEATRKRRLPSFRIALPDLEVLLSRLIPLFNNKKVSCNIDVKLKNQDLSFDSVEEMHQSKDLPTSVTVFTIWLNSDRQRLFIQFASIFNNSYEVTATSESEAWCAGAVEVVYQFISSHRVWYSWFRGWPIVAGLLLSLYTPMIFSKVPSLKLFTDTYVFYASWASIAGVFIILYFGQKTILPAATLRIAETESTLRKYLPEVTLAVSILALFLTIIGWFFKSVIIQQNIQP